MLGACCREPSCWSLPSIMWTTVQQFNSSKILDHSLSVALILLICEVHTWKAVSVHLKEMYTKNET